jgi:hypothetical protein
MIALESGGNPECGRKQRTVASGSNSDQRSQETVVLVVYLIIKGKYGLPHSALI